MGEEGRRGEEKRGDRGVWERRGEGYGRGEERRGEERRGEERSGEERGGYGRGNHYSQMGSVRGIRLYLSILRNGQI